MFTITGQVLDDSSHVEFWPRPAESATSRRSVTWVGPDRLEGDTEMIARARQAVADGVRVSPTPTSTDAPADLADPYLAMLTLSRCFEKVEALEGDLPETPERFAYRFDPDVIY